ncbi:MAG: M20/M25/M40 family metallo-hydrolase [Phycisphaerales bacterium]|nr:M20/M25/M40 family metallo-hydrolase [Phycisphaerales bacterium]
MRAIRPLHLLVLAGVAISTASWASNAAIEPPPSAASATLAGLPPAHDQDGNEVESYAVVDGEMVPVPAISMGDPRIIAKIFEEGTAHSQVMDTLRHLTEGIGPRLTGSANAETANKWARDQFESWGLKSSLFQWGTIGMRFDRGPSWGKIFLGRDEHDVKALTTLAWAPGTPGAVRGKAVRMPADQAEFDAVKDKLPGAWVVIPTDMSGRSGIRGVTGSANARYSARQEIRDDIGKPPPPPVVIPDDPIAGPWNGSLKIQGRDGYPCRLAVDKHSDGTITGTMAFGESKPGDIENASIEGETLKFEYETPRGRSRYEFHSTGGGLAGTSTRVDDPSMTFEIELSRPAPEPTGPSMLEQVMACNPAGYVSSSKDERVWTSSISGWRELTPETLAKDLEVIVSEPDYDYINSKLADGGDIELEFNMDNQLTPGPIPVYDTIAEIRGTEKPDEVVIVSAHLDSWNGPGSQGATDNGTGSSVTLEAARILAASGAKPKRTIRFILWTGEEQGLLGSKGYVDSLSEEERAKIVCCLVDDGGTNSEGGMHGIASQRDYLAAATAPINGRVWDEVDGKYLNVNVQIGEKMPQGGGSDHASFNAIGVPGYFWDEVGRAEYGFGWHTQHDRVDLAIPNYLRQSATNAAIVAYNLACAPDMLPREIKAESTSEAPAR